MRKLLTFALLLFGLRAAAANGDISGLTIGQQGYDAFVYVDGLGTNGTHSTGLGTYNRLTGNETGVLRVTVPAHNDLGVLGTVVRQLYVTEPINRLYPDQTINEETNITQGVLLRRAVSATIAAGDTIVFNNTTNFYSQGGTNVNAQSGLVVTNSAVPTHQPAIFRWTWPGLQRWTGATGEVRAFAIHHSAGNHGAEYNDPLGRPVRFIRFIFTGVTSGVKYTNDVYYPELSTLNEASPQGDYIGRVPLSIFTDNELVRNDAQVFPFWGGTNAMFDTTLNLYSSPLPIAITNRCDPDDDYRGSMGIVDPTTGNDSTGLAFDPNVVDYTTVTNYFATLAGAITKLAATNNVLFSHNDLEASRLLVRDNSTNVTWLGGSHSITAKSQTWFSIEPYPGFTPTIVYRSGTQDAGDAVKVSLRFQIAASQIPFSGIDYLWIDQSPHLESTSTGPIVNCGVYITRNVVKNFAQGFRVSSPASHTTVFHLVRGNWLDGLSQTIAARVTMGNRSITTNGVGLNLVTGIAGQITEPGFELIYGNWMTFGSGSLSVYSETNCTHGVAVVNNMFEKWYKDGTLIATFSSPGRTMTNCVVVGNTFYGERWAGAWYDDQGDGPWWKVWITALNNYCENIGWKADVFAVTNNPVGNLSVMYGCSQEGWVVTETSGTNANGDFPPYWEGLHSYNAGRAEVGGTNAFGFPKFVNQASGDYPTYGAGLGDYRFKSGAPFLSGHTITHPLTFDISGQYRRKGGPAGAYAGSDPKKSAVWFAE